VSRIAGKALILPLILLAVSAQGVNKELPNALSLASQPAFNSQALAGQVHAIFAMKCVECHGADIERPKGKFGYVLDLARVAGNPKMIVPGKPAQSELYQLVLHNEMPNPKGGIPPLTPAQKDIVKQWIEAGAPADVSDGNAPATKPLTLGRRVIRDIGQFHPPSSHFPIALLIVALPAEVMWALTRKPSWKATVRFCVMLGAAGAVITATLGWCDAASLSFTGTSALVLEWHRWFGTATAVWAVLTAGLSELAHRRGNSRGLRYGFRLTLLTGIVLVNVAGYLGASLIYGLNHYTW
jgi:uncharacterized membrane protein/mono/diheme cytochrome c family protein